MKRRAFIAATGSTLLLAACAKPPAPPPPAATPATTPSTTAVAPELRTQKRSPATPRKYASPPIAPRLRRSTGCGRS